MEDVASATPKPCRDATSDRGSRGAETALPLLIVGACDQALLHMVRVRCLDDGCALLSSCGALWTLPYHLAMSSGGDGVAVLVLSGFKYTRSHEI